MNPASPVNPNALEDPDRSGEDDARYLLESAASLVEADMGAVNAKIHHSLNSDIALIRSVAAYIINSGGKRLRPVTLLLAARALGGSGEKAITLAAVIEFIHTATLLHDDVVDASELRRGNDTANAIWGNEASVLVGDFLYSRAFELMVETESMEVMRVMAETTNKIAEGEVLQLLNVNSPDISEAQYFETITRKTAKLFESAGRLAAIVSDAGEKAHDGLAVYGLHLGIAFQIVDDMLDYTQSAASMGKDGGDDLAEGKPTLPVIYALAHANRKDVKFLREAIEKGDRANFARVVEIIESTNALAYTSRRAREEAIVAKNALSGLPDSRFKQALADLADFSVARTF